jgi:tRNA A37 threonylcarbamoyladenosine synthetase subunit TsaC/SUA5/YrdC
MRRRNVRQQRNLVVFQGIKSVQHKCQVGNLTFVGEATGNCQAITGHSSPHAVRIPQAEYVINHW